MRSPPAGHASLANIAVYPAAAVQRACGPQATLRPRPPGDMAGLAPAQLREIYTFIYLTRRLEEMLVALHRQGQVVGGVYRSLGQEGTAVGCAYAMRPGDVVQPLIRDLGASLVHGVQALAIFRQYMAKATGPTGGRDLNNHFSSPQDGILGPISMLGASIPVLAGCLLAAQLQGKPRAGLGFTGDGGSSTGAFYEGVNFAAVQKLPMVVVIEANQYAYSTPTTSQLPAGDLLCRARGFGCAVLEIDGNDVLACFEATRHGRQRGMAGDGPTLVVAHTYRRRGHAEHDNQAYLSNAQEPELWAEHNDPLQRLTEHLLHSRHANEGALQAIRSSVDQSLAAQRDQALADPAPEATSQPQGVFADATQPWAPPSTWLGAGAVLRDGGNGA